MKKDDQNQNVILPAEMHDWLKERRKPKSNENKGDKEQGD